MSSVPAHEITLSKLKRDLGLFRGFNWDLTHRTTYQTAKRVADLFAGPDYAVMRSELRDELRKLVWDAMPQGTPEFGAAIIVERVVGPWLARFFLGQEEQK